MLSVGSKVQVWRGNAKKTSSGLTKKDITRVKVTVKRDGRKKQIWRYKSKKQQKKGKMVSSKSQRARAKWTSALKKGRKDLNKKYPKTKKHLVLVLKPGKKYSKLGLTKEKLMWGRYLYVSAKKYYN
jgi:iron uptake system EfeUOB component EfeO/EfeM